MKEKLKNNYIYILNSILLLLLIVGDIFYINNGLLWVKSLTSLVFVIVGLCNFIYVVLYKKDKSNLKFMSLLLIGLLFAMLGDILLEVNFIVGAIFFGIGHIFFFISYLQLMKFNLRDLICFIIICLPAILFITLFKEFDFGSVLMEIVVCGYAIIISLMLSKSISNLIGKISLTNIYIFVGSSLFFLSDFVLLFNIFYCSLYSLNALCLCLYYPAEFVLAYTILANFDERNRKNIEENDNKLEEKSTSDKIEKVQKEDTEDNKILKENIEKKNNNGEDKKNGKVKNNEKDKKKK